MAGRDVVWMIGDLPALEAAELLLRLVWHSLLQNALKYSHQLEQALIKIERTGIGLANVKWIVMRHGSGFWPTGEVDRDTTVSFALPEGNGLGCMLNLQGRSYPR